MDFLKRKPIRTGDGSLSLELDGGTETYHSRHGAVQESRHVFIAEGLDAWRSKPGVIRILEVGFGTGLNALLAWEWAEQHQREVHFQTLEPYPLKRAEWEALSFEIEVLGAPKAWSDLHGADWERTVPLSGRFSLEKLRLTWEDWNREPVDVVFFDAFGPPTQPEMWTSVSLLRAARALRPEGMLVTYCAKGVVRRRMEQAGLVVERLPGPPGKREMLRAIQPKEPPAPIDRFNIRCYLLIADQAKHSILVSDECIRGEHVTKFPGGGLEFGEGVVDCLEREALEELGQTVEVGQHFYTTEGFVRSAYREADQVVSIYCEARLNTAAQFRTAQRPMDFPPDGGESFRWVHWEDLHPEDFRFPADQAVVRRLLDQRG